jgi:hypothetical protein
MFKSFYLYLYIMKLQVSEKQLKRIISELKKEKESDMVEQDSPVSSQPSSGTSSTQSGGTGYPEVGKWETGLTRGPANQVGVTKWSDIVGANLKRGKANSLK